MQALVLADWWLAVATRRDPAAIDQPMLLEIPDTMPVDLVALVEPRAVAIAPYTEGGSTHPTTAWSSAAARSASPACSPPSAREAATWLSLSRRPTADDSTTPSTPSAYAPSPTDDLAAAIVEALGGPPTVVVEVVGSSAPGGRDTFSNLARGANPAGNVLVLPQA
jgi:hypothetical protein